MRLKTYWATYLLFLLILFLCFGIVSAYMTSTQINMSMEKCEAEYQTISYTLTKDIIILMNGSSNFSQGVTVIAESYAEYYNQNGVDIYLTESPGLVDAKLSFSNEDGKRLIRVNGSLPVPYERFKLDYSYDLTENIASLQNINRTLLIIFVTFSVVTAVSLYLILSGIFRPLGIVSAASQKIASGCYSERITVKGINEISAMAQNFNLMAGKIENQIRALEEELAGKQRFIDNFAHEIRTPLTAIYGYAEYLQRALLDGDEIIELSQFIMDRTNHMTDIAGSLLQLATLRNYTPQKTVVTLGKLFEDINWTLKRPVEDRGIKFTADSGGLVLVAQEDLIKSMLLNLCFNAIKACPDSGGKIHLEAAYAPSKAVMLSVTDNGFGIPEDSVEKVTEPFYRVNKSHSREQGSAGLGLALCMQIAKVHRAEMKIESKVGEGTSVKITFTGS